MAFVLAVDWVARVIDIPPLRIAHLSGDCWRGLWEVDAETVQSEDIAESILYLGHLAFVEDCQRPPEQGPVQAEEARGQNLQRRGVNRYRAKVLGGVRSRTANGDYPHTFHSAVVPAIVGQNEQPYGLRPSCRELVYDSSSYRHVLQKTVLDSHSCRVLDGLSMLRILGPLLV